VIQVAYKYRIYPNTQQRIFFAKTFGCVRFFYNKSLNDMKEYYEKNKKFFNYTPASYKKEHAFLKEVDSLALANAQLNRNKAFKAFFNKQNGFPKYKLKRNYQSYTTNNQNGTIYLSDDHKYISFPKIKDVRIKLHRFFHGVIKSATISKTCDDKYYVSLLIEEEAKVLPKTNNTVGIDVGLKSFLSDSSNNVVDNPKYYVKSQERLTKAQKKLSHMEKGSKNYSKQRKVVASIHSHIVNQRNDFLHKLSFSYVNDNQIIATEDLKVKNMESNSHLSKSIADASWAKFIGYLSYKANWYNRLLVKVPTNFPSSQLCSKCGYQNKLVKDLSVRNWTCPNCNTTHDRDNNASINILNKGLEILKARTLPDSLLILE